jgi:protein MpaA
MSSETAAEPAPHLRARPERGRLELTPTRYGVSRDGLPLQVFMPPGGRPPRHLVFAGIHGTEPDSTVIVSAALRSIDPSALRSAVVLAANPEGLLLGTRGNASGVELNRNWPSSTWRPDPVPHRWTLADPRDVTLSPGTEPASEPEVQALIELIHALSPEVIVSVHSPLACIDDPEGLALGAWLAQRTGLERVLDVGYPTPGSFGTWAAEQDRRVITYELPPVSITGMVTEQVPALADLLAGDSP